MRRRALVGITLADHATIDDLNTLHERLLPIRELAFVESLSIFEEDRPSITKARPVTDIKVRRRQRIG